MKNKLLHLFSAALAVCFATTLRSAESSNKYAPLAYTPLGNYGQALVDMEMAKHPELKILTIHVTPPGIPADVDNERRLMFSNIGRIGKLDSIEDSKIFKGGKEVVEAFKNPAPPSTNFSITATPKYEVWNILKDQFGKDVGLIVMVFPYHENFDLEKYHEVAKTVVEELNSRMTTKDDLFKPAS
ncbi:MAG: hypothetical protein PHQ04_04695 [Opitutaceae bacterium]|nr:hypothetical protein [Opitutaceae bacterium]